MSPKLSGELWRILKTDMARPVTVVSWKDFGIWLKKNTRGISNTNGLKIPFCY